MPDWATSERVVALKSEIATLRQTDDAYTTKRRRTPKEDLEHIKRMQRLQEILGELTALTPRKTPAKLSQGMHHSPLANSR